MNNQFTNSIITFPEIKQLIEIHLRPELSEEMVNCIKEEINKLENHFHFIPGFVIDVLYKDLQKFQHVEATNAMLTAIMFLNTATKIKIKHDERNEHLVSNDIDDEELN